MSRAPSLTPLDLQNADLLRRLARGPAPESQAALAAELKRDGSNLSKSISALDREGRITRDRSRRAPVPEITAIGRAVVDALDRAAGQGGGADDAPVVHWGQLLENPDNPRKVFDEAEIRALAETIADKGLIQPILLRSDGPGPDGSWVVEAGERRRRAIGLLVAEGRWGADQPVPVRVSEAASDAAVLENALIENLQRADMAWIDEALAFRRLKDEHGRSTAQIARLIGSPAKQRMVQQYIQVAGAMTDDEVRRARLPRFLPEGGPNPDWLGFKEALAEVQEKRAASPADVAPPARLDWAAERRVETRKACEGLTDKPLLALVEAADKCLRAPARGWGRFATLIGRTDGDPTGLCRLMPGPLGGGWGNGPGPDGGRENAVMLDEDARDWLIEKGYLTDVGADPTRLGLLRQKVAGIGGEARLRAEGRYWTPWLNLDPAPAAGADPRSGSDAPRGGAVAPSRIPSGPSAPPTARPFVEPTDGARAHLLGFCRRIDDEPVSPAGWGRLILGRLPGELETRLQADGAVILRHDQRHGWTVELTEAAKRWWAAQKGAGEGAPALSSPSHDGEGNRQAVEGSAADATDPWGRTADQVEADRQLLADTRTLNQGPPWSNKAGRFAELLGRLGLQTPGPFDIDPVDGGVIEARTHDGRIGVSIVVDQDRQWPDERSEALALLIVGALNRAARAVRRAADETDVTDAAEQSAGEAA